MRRCAVVLLMLALVGLATASETASLTDQTIQPLQVVNRQITDSGISLTLEVGEPMWISVDAENGDQLEMASYPLSGYISEDGMPAVPVASSLFRIPPRSGVSVEIIEAEYETYSDVEYASMYTEELDDGINEIYRRANAEDRWFPGNLAEAGEPAIFHDFRVTNLLTYPVQVNPARREVRVYSNIRVQITYEGVDERNALEDWPTRISRSMVPKYEAFLDWELDELNDYEFYDGNVQVVMVDDDALWAAMEDWFTWKREKGWKLDFIHPADVGTWSAANIRAELIERYNNNPDKFDYIVIIGDDQGSFAVPPGSGSSGYGAGDQPYSCIVGDDNLADIGIGRISIQTVAQAVAYQQKVLTYERDVDFDNTDWYLRGMLNRADTHAGISKVIMLRYYKYLMLQHLGFTQVDTVMWGNGDNFAMQRIDDGVSFYGGRGYLGYGLSTGEIAQLENDNMTPVVIDVTCGTGNWSQGTSISEAYMLAGTVQAPRGGVVAMSMATSGTRPDFNNVLSGASGWSMLQMQWPTPGDMMLAGKINGWVNYHGHNDATLNSFLQWYNLMGDPLVYIWTDIPHELDVDAPASMVLGQHEYSVIVTEDGEPVVDAWVTFLKESGGDNIQVSKYTDETGSVTFYPEVGGAGEAKLTVTKYNCAPVQVDVAVSAFNATVGWDGITIIDNGVGGTIGDGDGIPEAGERVGLQMLLKNYGGAEATDISITGDSDDPYINDVYGSVSLGSLSPNQSSQGSGMVIVDIADFAQDRWLAIINLAIETDDGTVEDAYQLTLNAPNFVITQVTLSGDLQPGQSREAILTVGNIGGSDATAGTALFVSRDPWLRVTQYNGTVPALDINSAGVSSSFQVEALVGSFPGYEAKAMLLVTTETGQVDTAYTTVLFGTREESDPIGPDNYGYMGFDNIDTDWDYAPVYDWVEINPDAPNNDYSGIALDISDLAENDEDEDMGVTLDLEEIAFPIQYYGETFTEISVHSNGTVAMGAQASISSNRNWTIPSAAGPSGMLAPYWDELQTNGDCAILYHYDEDNDRLIFEFYKMRHHVTSYESTFEVIIYDTEAYPTATGDNEIVFQYGECDHSTGGMTNDVPYWTTGIESNDQSDGLLVAYWNEYTDGSASITQGRAIKFTTNIAVPVGRIHGVISDLETGNPIENAIVRTSDWMFTAVTDAEGEYAIDSVFIGNYDLVVEAVCYNETTIENISVADGSDETANAQMTHPEFELSTLMLSTEIAPDSAVFLEFAINNDGNGPLTYNASLHFPNEALLNGNGDSGNRGPVQSDNELDEAWDQIYQFDLDQMELRYRGVVFDGEYFWLSGSNNYDVSGPNKLYQYDAEGMYLATFDQPVPAEDRTSQGFYGMAWDGEYLYAADGGIMYQMEFDETEWTVLDTWEVPANPARYIVLDPNTYYFYIGDYGTEIRAIHPDSSDIIYEFGQEFYPRGGGWFPEDEDGYNIYFIAQQSGEAMISFVKMDPVTGDTRPIYSTQVEEGYLATGGDITYFWDPSVWQFISVLESSDLDKVTLWEVDTYSNWVEVLNPTGTVEAEGSNTVELRVHSYGLPPDTFNVAIEISHDACTENQEWVDLTMIVYDPKGIEDHDVTDLPTEFSFDGAYPNPFNPVATVRFGLPQTAVVKATVFNLLGQKVATLTNQPMQAGYHQLTFDGSNLASGMYFLNFQSGPINETTRLILMK